LQIRCLYIYRIALTAFTLIAVCGGPLSAEEPVHLVSTEIKGGQLESKDGKYVGAYATFFDKAATQSGTKIDYRLVPWVRAVKETEHADNLLLFPFTRTPERENRFTWLVKLNEDPLCFASQKGPINSIDAARKLKRVLVWRGSSNQTYLEKLGFENLILVSSMKKAVHILKSDPNAAVYVTCEQAKSYLLSESPNNVFKVGAPVSSEIMWLVGSKSLKRTAAIDKLAVAIEALEKTRLLRKLLDEAER